MYSIGKLMWMKEHRPEIFEKAKYIFLMEDLVVYHLTGERRIDHSLASRTMAFDIHTLSFSDEILKTAGIGKELFSHPVPTGTIAGEITETAAERCGLKQGTKVVSISHDQVAAVGACAFDAETAVDGAGTVGSAMLTGVALGIFKDISDAAAHMVEETETYEPRKERYEKYMAIYTRYKEVYNAVRPLV